MRDTVRPVRVVRAQSGEGHTEFARREPPPDLRPYVRDVCGYTERTAAPLQRREFPGPQVVVILEFAPPIRVFEVGCTHRSARYPGGFAAGITDQFTLTQHDGFQRGLQINLTPTGARRFFGLPLSELAGRAVSIRELLPADYHGLPGQLEALPDWEARFDRVERLLARRIAGSDLRSEAVSFALRYIEGCGGAADMRTLARELGYSQKHVIQLFRDRVGVPPKLLARIVRFDRLFGSLRRGAPESWSELALVLVLRPVSPRPRCPSVHWNDADRGAGDAGGVPRSGAVGLVNFFPRRAPAGSRRVPHGRRVFLRTPQPRI